MPLVDLKRTKSEKDNESKLCCDTESEDYSWGLQLDLQNEELEKLGIKKLNIGDEFEITAMVRVKSFSERATEGDGENKSAGLLIKAISMPDDSKSAADVIYNKE